MSKIQNANNYKKIIIILFLMILIVITCKNKYDSLISDFESEAKAKEAMINRHIDLSNSFIDSLAIYGNNYFKQKEHIDSELYNYLEYDSTSNTYNLDAIAGTEYQNNVGSLTGQGPIQESGLYRDEINLALGYNQYFNSLYKLMPDVAWLYYTSENNFINIYPWISSKDFSYTDELQKTEFYTYVTPQNNPLRKALWTPVYLDQAGKGLMVSLSSPIYSYNTFMGVISLDLTNVMLSEMIASKYEIYLIDSTDSIIATSRNIKFDKEVIKLNALLDASQDEMNQLKEAENKILRLKDYYIYSFDFNNAPWKMYLRVSVWSIIYQSILFTLPLLLICIFLLFTIFEIEKRKRAEAQLTNSLEELQSYQTLLENAAKFDFLTSTYNRRGFKQAFDKTVTANTADKTPISFILGDIDHFKDFNDTYGHAAGDKVLIEIATLMKSNNSDDDLVCRWGGEEFLIMLYNKTYEEAKFFAEDIRRQIEAVVIPWDNSKVLKVTMTFGVTEYDYDGSYETSISEADSALYIGKFKGRNQVIIYQSLMAHEQILRYEW